MILECMVAPLEPLPQLLHGAFVLRLKSQHTAFSQEVKSATTDSNILPSSSVSLKEIYQVFVIISRLCCHLLQRTVESSACSQCHKFPMNCKKLQALSVQTFRQDKLQLFSPVSGAVQIYIMARSAPSCGTSLKGEINCVLLVPYLCLESSVKIHSLIISRWILNLFVFLWSCPVLCHGCGGWQTQLQRCCSEGAGRKLLRLW